MHRETTCVVDIAYTLAQKIAGPSIVIVETNLESPHITLVSEQIGCRPHVARVKPFLVEWCRESPWQSRPS